MNKTPKTVSYNLFVTTLAAFRLLCQHWAELLRKDGINSKQIVLDQIENILKGKK